MSGGPSGRARGAVFGALLALLFAVPPARAASFEQQALQVAKQARLVREAAERFAVAARASADAGRPVEIAVLEAENEAVKVNLRRLRSWVLELEQVGG